MIDFVNFLKCRIHLVNRHVVHLENKMSRRRLVLLKGQYTSSPKRSIKGISKSAFFSQSEAIYKRRTCTLSEFFCLEICKKATSVIFSILRSGFQGTLPTVSLLVAITKYGP